MSLLKEIEDKGAVLEWSPVVGRPNLAALGTKDSSGVGFDDYGGGIELHSLDFADSKNTSSKLLGKAKSKYVLTFVTMVIRILREISVIHMIMFSLKFMS